MDKIIVNKSMRSAQVVMGEPQKTAPANDSYSKGVCFFTINAFESPGIRYSLNYYGKTVDYVSERFNLNFWHDNGLRYSSGEKSQSGGFIFFPLVEWTEAGKHVVRPGQVRKNDPVCHMTSYVIIDTELNTLKIIDKGREALILVERGKVTIIPSELKVKRMEQEPDPDPVIVRIRFPATEGNGQKVVELPKYGSIFV